MEEKNFIVDFCRLSETTEVPKIFALWSGVAAISAALGRKSFLRFGPMTYYPNFFILLTGASGQDRKSTAIAMAMRIIGSLQPKPRIISGAITPQKLIDELSKVETTDLTKLLSQDGTGFAAISEFTSFLNKRSYEMGLATLLIDLYDCLDEVTYGTISRGGQIVKNSCLTILGGSTMDWLRGGIPSEAIGGGLTSRMIFIQFEGTPKRIAWPIFDHRMIALQQELSEYLQRVSTSSGEFQISDEAKEFCIEEYSAFLDGEGALLAADPALSGYTTRRQMHQLKLSMIFSASENLQRMIELRHIKMATAALMGCEESLPKVISKITSTQIGGSIDLIMNVIKRFARNGWITRSELQRKVAHRMAVKELDEVLGTLLLSTMVIQRVEDAALAYQARDMSKDER